MKSKFLIVGGAEFFSKALAWLTLAVIPFFSSPEVYGEIVLYYSIIIVLIPFFLFGQDRLILKNNPNQELINSFVFSFFLIFLFSFIFIYFDYFGLALVGFVLTLNKIYLTYLRAIENLKSYAFNRIVYSILRFVFVFYVVYFLYTEKNYIFAELLAGAIVSFGMLVLIIKNGIFFNISWRERFFHGLPLMLHGLSVFGIALIDRFVLEYYTNLTVVGNYSFIYIFASGLIFLYSVIGIVMEKKIYKSNDNIELSRNIRKTFLYMLFIGFTGSIFSFILYVFLIKFNLLSDYLYLPLELILLLLAHIFLPIYLVSNYFLIQKGKNIYLLYASFLSLFINFLTNIVFVPLYGLSGAVYATLLSNLILCITVSFISYRLFKISNESLCS